MATDIAARGIDVDGISHVANFDLPHVPETYVHRIGRTARAGAAGIAISLCDGEEVALLREIEKLIRMTIPLTDRRTDQRRAEGSPAMRGPARSPGDAKQQRRGQRGGPARMAGQLAVINQTAVINQMAVINKTAVVNKTAVINKIGRDQPNEAPGGIASVAFMQGKSRPARHRAQRAPHQAGH